MKYNLLCLFNRSSIDVIIDIIKKIISYREEIDSKQNAIDEQHDLPVYHRIQNILQVLIYHINQFDDEKKVSFRLLCPIILQFDKTVAPLLGKLLIKIAQNKEDIEDALKFLEENLSENYFERVLTNLATCIDETDSCPFLQQSNIDEKLSFAQWFLKEKNRPLFVFDLLKNHIFNQSGFNQEQCRNILQELRQSKDLFLKEQAMTYNVPWKEENTNYDDDNNTDVLDD